MSVTLPTGKIPRWSVVGMEGMFTKMWDPPNESPATPDLLLPTNPVPEVMAAAGMASPPIAPHTMQLELLHGLSIPTWDGLKQLHFFTFVNPDVPATTNGTYPGTTIRVPVGAVFHCSTSGKGPPPHTIHWHGIEPTPMNDGVGHCSMEIGKYTYQWQPTFVGTYFYHCHRNTMMHFEYGLFGLLVFEPADAYFATLADPSIPIGHCRDGKRRTGANLAPTAMNPTGFPQFPGWQGGLRTDPDPWIGDPTKNQALTFPSDPHAMTVPYDVEAIWVFDDRDSVWSDLTQNAFTSYPKHGAHPGYDDQFALNPGTNGFLAFNDFGADYWFVTGEPVPAHQGGTGTIPAGLVIPPELNSGISGSQISVEGYVGQTILIRALDAAYNNCTYTFPVDIVILEWDGRPLGVPPYGFNEPYLVPAGTPIEVAVGRRFGGLIREFAPVNTFAICKFIDTRGANVAGLDTSGQPYNQVVCTAKVPLNISPLTVTATTSLPSPQPAGTPITITATMTGNPGSQAPTSGAYEYRFWVNSGSGFNIVQNYSAANTCVWTPAANGAYDILVDIRSIGSTAVRDALTKIFSYQIQAAAATGVTVTPNLASPQAPGTPITFTAAAQGGSGSYEYRFWINSGSGFNIVQDFSATNALVWTPAATGAYDILVDARNTGSTSLREATTKLFSYQIQPAPATGVTVTPSLTSPQAPGTPITFTASGQGGSGTYEFQFWVNSGAGYNIVQPYSATNTFVWTPATTGNYDILVDVRNAGSTAVRDALVKIFFYQIQ
jgi:Multicopper oxidase